MMKSFTERESSPICFSKKRSRSEGLFTLEMKIFLGVTSDMSG